MSEATAPQAPDPTDPLDETPPPVSREQRRSRRKREVRATTISITRMTKRERQLGRLLYPEQPGIDYERPQTRGDCENGPRPCPYVSCVHHLYLDVSDRTGAIKLNYPDLEVDELDESCALDIADRGGVTLEETGAIMNLTRERIRQLELIALAPLRPLFEAMGGPEAFSNALGGDGRRRLPVLRTSEAGVARPAGGFTHRPLRERAWYAPTMEAVRRLTERGKCGVTALAREVGVSINLAYWRLRELVDAGELSQRGRGDYVPVDEVDLVETEAPPAAAE
jgi:hypothetical protein